MSAIEPDNVVDATAGEQLESSADAARTEPETTKEARATAEPASATADDEPEALGKDLIFETLKNRRRRLALHYLREHGETTLSDLAEHVAAVENDKPVAQLDSNERKRVYVGLYQCHLPKMADTGLVEYEQARGTVELNPEADQVFPYLDLEPGQVDDGEDDADTARGCLGRLVSRLSSAIGR